MQTQINRSINLPLVLGAFVIGVVVTVGVTSRRTPPVETATGEKKTEKLEEKGADETDPKIIPLNDEAARMGGVVLQTVKTAPFGDTLLAPGTVQVGANHGAKITPPTSGKIVRLLAQPGDTVRMGQPLAVIDSFEVAQAQAAIKQADSSLQLARADIQTAAAEAGQARVGVRQAEAEAEQARTRHRSAETALKRQQEMASAGAFSQPSLTVASQEKIDAQSELSTAEKEDEAHETVLARTERLFKAELVSRAEMEADRAHHEQDHIRVERARARLELAQKTFDREQKIANAGLLTAREVQTAEAEVRAAQAEVQKALQGVSRAQQDVTRASKSEAAARTALRGAESGLAAARANLAALAGNGSASGGLVTISSPIGGTIAEHQATLGQTVDKAAILFVVENLNAVMVIAQVPERDVALIRVGQTVEVNTAAYPRERFSGVVQSLAGRVDEKTRTLPVRCLVENPKGLLKPEMFAQVNLSVGARTEALIIPASALDSDGGKTLVYVHHKEGYEQREISIGKRTSTQVEVTSGLKQGERVVTDGVFVLKSEANRDKLKEED